MLRGAGVEYHREPRLDIAICKDLPMTMVFLPASDIPKYVGEGNVDIGVTGIDIVEENGDLEVQRVMDLGFGKCRLCVQAPVAKAIKDVKELAGKRIVTSFPVLTKKFFDPLDQELGVKTNIRFVSGSVEAACGLGLADAVVDLVETGTTMKVSCSFATRCSSLYLQQNLECNRTLVFHPITLSSSPGGWARNSTIHPRHSSYIYFQSEFSSPKDCRPTETPH